MLTVFISCNKKIPDISDSDLKSDQKAIILNGDRSIVIDTTVINSFKSKTLQQFYTSSKNKTVWGNRNKRNFVLSQLKNAEELGLNPNDYNITKLNNYESKINDLDDKELALYDLLLTYNFETYLNHLNKGKLDPKKIYRDWALTEKSFDVNKALIESFNNNKLDSLVLKVQPQTATYKQLLKALKIINNFPEDDHIETIVSSEKIRLNDKNPAIINIKKRLLYWNDMSSNDSLTSQYDEKILEPVKKFQTRHGLESDGVIGAGTIHALNFSRAKRKQQIIANLERWRWYSNEFPETYFIINIPNYSLHVIENKDTTIVRKVVVGTSKRKTPVLSSTLKTIVFNPTWTVPPTILKEDVVPAMKRNRNYLRNKNITIYNASGNEVDPLDWNENKPGNYRYVQSPGSNNSLGLMKILFPNNYSVYLHDTNHRNYFQRHNRSLSSGCVRIENPLELAQHILNDPKSWSKEKIDAIIESKKTTSIKITKKYTLYQWYWTAWSEKNELIFRYDIYDLDSDLYALLRN